MAQRSGAELGALIEEATVDTYDEVGAVNGFLPIVDELLRQVLGHLHLAVVRSFRQRARAGRLGASGIHARFATPMTTIRFDPQPSPVIHRKLDETVDNPWVVCGICSILVPCTPVQIPRRKGSSPHRD
ncbi:MULTISPECIES: hypothetical protein [Streptomyces]|uniref:hypothetical protein n=1 Tax=Streptomyces TaxID=1883 RepID=UPI000D144BF7|nr:hypothetical protein [Streptomyces griseolus]